MQIEKERKVKQNDDVDRVVKRGIGRP